MHSLDAARLVETAEIIILTRTFIFSMGPRFKTTSRDYVSHPKGPPKQKRLVVTSGSLSFKGTLPFKGTLFACLLVSGQAYDELDL